MEQGKIDSPLRRRTYGKGVRPGFTTEAQRSQRSARKERDFFYFFGGHCPLGLGFFVQSSSPDWTKRNSTSVDSVSPW